MNINYLVENTLKDPDALFQNGKPNENAKYFPKFSKKIKNSTVALSSKLKKLLHINPRNIRGTEISVDANDEELEADKILRSQGYMT